MPLSAVCLAGPGGRRGMCVGRWLGSSGRLRRVLEEVQRTLRDLHEEVQVKVGAARVLVQTQPAVL